jgi:hypothetical protein
MRLVIYSTHLAGAKFSKQGTTHSAKENQFDIGQGKNP